MKKTHASAYRSAAVIAGLIVALAGTTGCSGGGSILGDSYDKTKSYTYDDMQEDDASTVLPSWVPQSATDIKELQRTTGHERIFTLTLDEPLPSRCVAMKTPGDPTSKEIEAGLADSSWAEDQIEGIAKNQHRTPLLEADWWPAGQEKKATHLCDKWWVSHEGGTLYAYTPETKVIAEGVLKEREGTE